MRGRCATPLRVFRREVCATRAVLAGKLGPWSNCGDLVPTVGSSISTERIGRVAARQWGVLSTAQFGSSATGRRRSREAGGARLSPPPPPSRLRGSVTRRSPDGGSPRGGALPRRPRLRAEPHDRRLVVAADRGDPDGRPRGHRAPPRAVPGRQVPPPPRRSPRHRAPPPGHADPADPPRPRRRRGLQAASSGAGRGASPQGPRPRRGATGVWPGEARIERRSPGGCDPSPGARPGRERLRGRVPAPGRVRRPADPRADAYVEGLKVDALWREASSSSSSTGTRRTPTRSPTRRIAAASSSCGRAGYRVIRYTWRQVTREPQTVVNDLRRSWPPPRLAAPLAHDHPRRRGRDHRHVAVHARARAPGRSASRSRRRAIALEHHALLGHRQRGAEAAADAAAERDPLVGAGLVAEPALGPEGERVAGRRPRGGGRAGCSSRPACRPARA